ncbi:MAG: HAD-IA family hydrolase [Sphingomonadaceae bacterium]
MNRLAIFDCDGTLVDSQHNICLAMEDCFQRGGLIAPDRAAIRRIVGLSLVEAVCALAPDAEPALQRQMSEDYKTAFQRLRGFGLVDEPLFDGVAEMISALAEDGWILGVATGKSDRGLTLCLEHHGIAHHFATLQTADRHPSKPHPSMIHQAMNDAGAMAEDTLMIGDTGFDIGMARAAGVTAIGVAWGYHDPAELIEQGAHHVADVANDIVTIARKHP